MLLNKTAQIAKESFKRLYFSSKSFYSFFKSCKYVPCECANGKPVHTKKFGVSVWLVLSAALG